MYAIYDIAAHEPFEMALHMCPLYMHDTRVSVLFVQPSCLEALSMCAIISISVIIHSLGEKMGSARLHTNAVCGALLSIVSPAELIERSACERCCANEGIWCLVSVGA